MVANMTNEKERLHHSRFPDSGGPPDFGLPSNVESALLSNIVYGESFSEFKRKSQAFKLNLSLIRTRRSLPQPGKENFIIRSAIRGRMDMGISFLMI